MFRLHSRSGRDSRRRLGFGVATAAVLLAVAAPAAQAAPFVYVTGDHLPGKVFQFDAGAGGLLAPLSPPTVAADQRPTEAEVSPDGRTLYVANSGAYEDGDPGGPDFGDTVSQYDIGADGSALAQEPARRGGWRSSNRHRGEP